MAYEYVLFFFSLRVGIGIIWNVGWYAINCVICLYVLVSIFCVNMFVNKRLRNKTGQKHLQQISI